MQMRLFKFRRIKTFRIKLKCSHDLIRFVLSYFSYNLLKASHTVLGAPIKCISFLTTVQCIALEILNRTPYTAGRTHNAMVADSNSILKLQENNYGLVNYTPWLSEVSWNLTEVRCREVSAAEEAGLG